MRYAGLYKDLRILFPGLCLILFSAQSICANDVRVAVASNFSIVSIPLAEAFTQTTGYKVMMSYASTGKLYAQIVNGAPFDVLLAADLVRPLKLETDSVSVPGTRFTYAVGQLVLWSPKKSIDVDMVLKKMQFRHLAIANEKLAPYGRAAMEYLTDLGLWPNIQDRLVRGENIGQAFHFVASESAQLGLVAGPQAKNAKGTSYLVPQSHYSPINQQAVLLQDNPASRRFLTFLQSSEGKNIIKAHGFMTP